MAKNKKYFLFHKPRNVLSRFTKEHGKTALSNFGPFPTDVYPVGRLDEKSEGLLLLTNDKKVNSALLHPENQHEREYIVQLDGQITGDAVKQLEAGVTISLPDKQYTTKPCTVKKTGVNSLPEPDFQVHYNKQAGTSAIKITLTEGKNRQVRRMCAAVGFPVVRLVRTRIEDLHLADLQRGKHQKIPRDVFYRALKLY